MPRKPRKLVTDGYYHVIVKGSGNQIIFEEDRDYLWYLKQLELLSEKMSVGICAYCLMDNHVHLLIHDTGKQLPKFMQRLNTKYATYYNLKYQHNGHLFQERYKSEWIDSERYFLTVLKYIIYNPEKAGFCKATDYPCNSYQSYFDKNEPMYGFLERDLINTLFMDKNVLKNYLSQKPTDHCLEHDINQISDENAKEIIQNVLHVKSGTEIQKYTKQQRTEAIRKLKKEKLSIRQIERLTGINRGIIFRA